MKDEIVKPISFCSEVAQISTDFEKCNTNLKKEYLIKNIEKIHAIMSSIDGYCGTFGTGYPFYALERDKGTNLVGNIPVIREQIRYNNELAANEKMSEKNLWYCASCLSTCGSTMPDLKQICKPCPKMDDELKPRKLLNRLPDIDMWVICKDEYVEAAKRKLPLVFEHYDMHTSDVDPLKTIDDIAEITKDLQNGVMPEKLLPLDVHIIEYSKMKSLIEEVPIVIEQYSKSDGQIAPYLPIRPHSLRKTWQHDDTAYNFVYDYLHSLTPIDWEEELNEELNNSRKIVSNLLNYEQFLDMLLGVAPDSQKRRMETKQLQKRYKERIREWKK